MLTIPQMIFTILFLLLTLVFILYGTPRRRDGGTAAPGLDEEGSRTVVKDVGLDQV